MVWVRNLLITFGAFWLSRLLVVLLSRPFLAVNNGITYGDSWLDAIALGIMTSMGRALAAAVGAGLVVFFAASPKPERWASIVAVLYLLYGSGSSHWYLPPTRWDYLWRGTDRVWPVIVCLAAAVIIARLRRTASERSEQP
jgi:hypothetical protein